MQMTCRDSADSAKRGMTQLLLLGAGYCAQRLGRRWNEEGWSVTGTSRDGRAGSFRLDDPALDVVLQRATHILSSIPPDAAGGDAGLDWLVSRMALVPPDCWIGYLSSTGVYPDTKGDWVDESADTALAHRSSRGLAESRWRALPVPVHVFRLPGIYGPGGRSALDRVREGRAHRIDLAAEGPADHVFSRVHVDDIIQALSLSMIQPSPGGGIWNVCDDLPASGNAVIEYACDLLGVPWPPLLRLDNPSLTPMMRSFYAASRRVSNGRIKRDLGWKLRYPTFREGLMACLTEDSLQGDNA
jgi:nucleoside-diphosphate-sugar epimerase